MTALLEDSRNDFENRMIAHLFRCFPSECETLGQNRVRDRVRSGIENARRYGVTLERDVCKYIDLMFTFGANFDTEPGSFWAADILNDDSLTNPSVKMDRLFAEAKRHVGAPAWSEAV